MYRLKWWFLFCASIVAVIASTFLGWMHSVIVADITKISLIILISYFSCSMFVGWLTYKAETQRAYYLDPAQNKSTNFLVERHLKACYMAVKSMIILGIIGTTAGLLVMLNLAFGSADMTPVTVLNGLKTGLSTLGITTLLGLICYLLLELQVVNLEYALE